MPSPSARPTRRPTALWALALLSLPTAVGCAKHIGDGCANNTECDIQGARLCDLTSNGGYCTVPECTPGTCPELTSCIEFEAHTPRLARRFCMVPCTSTAECRAGYVCQVPTLNSSQPTSMCPAVPLESGAPQPSCTRSLDPTPRLPGFCVQSE